MDTCVGVDLGTNSIGLSLIDLDSRKILYANTVLFPEGMTSIGLGDKEETPNVKRKIFRHSKKQHFREKWRRIKLLEVLIQYGMCPLSREDLSQWGKWDKQLKSKGRVFPGHAAFHAWLKLNPYELRARATREDVSLQEFGRICYHLIQRRGFLSSRKGEEDGKIFTGKEGMTGIDETRLCVKEQTLGSYLYEILPKDGEIYTSRPARVRGRYTLREMYVHEFNCIWERQAPQLGLDSEIIVQKRNIYIKGSLDNSRNRKHISRLQLKYGEEHVEVGDNEITVSSPIALKNFLGGYIEQDKAGIRFKSNESVLFWQRPIRSQKFLLSKCTFEGRPFYDRAQGKWITVGRTPVPLSHPEFEEYRAYKFINSIAYGAKMHLTEAQREVVFEIMCKEGKEFEFSKIAEELKIYDNFNYEQEEKVSGCRTIKLLKELFPKDVWEKHYHDIWHCFYFYEDNRMLFEKLKRSYGLIPDDIKKIKKIRLAEGYSNISLKAIRNIMPYLKKGYTESTAVLLGGIRNAFGKRFEYFKESEGEIERAVCGILREKNKEGEVIEKVKRYLACNHFGFTENDRAFNKLYHHSQDVVVHEKKEQLGAVENLRNPIVQQGLNELKRAINKLLAHCREMYGPDFKFDHIHVELGRDLKQSKTRRAQSRMTILKNKEENNEAREKLFEFGLKPTRENIQKYLLYKEIEKNTDTVRCPYTGRIISLADTLGRNNKIQIEHIIPYRISLDDSFANKTLCEANFNREKGEYTPYGFYKEDDSPTTWGAGSWEEVANRAFKLLPYAKAKRFTSMKEYKNEDFIDRQLNDTRYMSRKAVKYLSTICDDVKVFPGQLTAEIRHLWGLNRVLYKSKDIEIDPTEFADTGKTECYVVYNKDDENTYRVYRKRRVKPARDENEIVLAGWVNHNVFRQGSLPDIPVVAKDGKYWTVAGLSAPLGWYPLFAPKPVSEEGSIVLKGSVVKGVLTCKSLTKKIKTDSPDGKYWVELPVRNKVFEDGAKTRKKKVAPHYIQLFGTSKNGRFQSYIYNCAKKGEEGKFWCTLETDTEQVKLTRIKYDAPVVEGNQIVLPGSIDDQGFFHPDADIDFNIHTKEPQGKYYGVFEVVSRRPDIFPMQAEVPTPSKNETMVEGTIWKDKSTNEYKFDPVKNRDDQRHHAIDAIVIALLSNRLLKRLSDIYAKREDEKRGVDSTENFPLPWTDFVSDVQECVDNIYVSYKQNRKTACNVKKTVFKNGRKLVSKGMAARGALHLESVYGLREVPGSPLAFHKRKKIQEIKNKKHLAKVADSTIRKLLEEHLQKNYGIDTSKKDYVIPSNAFFKDGEYQVFLPNKRGEPVPIKKVRMRENKEVAQPLKSDVNQHVDLKNNHHVVIYKDAEGMFKERVVTFWEAVKRKNEKRPLFELPQDCHELVTILQKNDMYLLGLSNEEVEKYKNNRKVISKHLYRVQKLSSKYYTFKFHSVSNAKEEEGRIFIRSFEAWENQNPIKVAVDKIGNMRFLN